MRRVTLVVGKDCFAQWRDAARGFLVEGVAPDGIDWCEQRDGETGGLFAHEEGASFQAQSGEAKTTPTVPPAFIELAEAVMCHSTASRFSLLYRLLWRLQADRDLLAIAADADVYAARMLAKSVSRDCHKMKAFVRFKEVASPAGARRSFFAWFEPDHHIVARTAPFFQRRFTDMDWVIATPKGFCAWDGESLTLSDMPQTKPDLTDETDELWRTYFRNIFNPARLKIKAMQAEMPKKYWKNMPEAALIPEMISGAEARVREMAQAMATQPPLFHHRIREANAMATPDVESPTDDLDAVRKEAAFCTRCPLSCKATQTVFGEGAQTARTMLVGEQPGDQEDLAGRPFVGPAGRMLDGVLAEVGLKRETLYVTNAVKHFKYEPRGKRRIHKKPNAGEVKACRWWLTKELQLIAPKLTVAMGATALSALVEKRYALSELRGKAMESENGGQLFVTVHPSYLLRIPDEGRKHEEMQRFRADMVEIQRLSREAT